MLREGLALLSCVSLHHAHRPATGEGGGLQPLAIDSHGMQIKHRSFGGIADMRPALSSLMQISHSKASSDRDDLPENSINVQDAEISGRINSCEGINRSKVATWDENCEAGKTLIKKWAALFRDNPRNFKSWNPSMVWLEASPLKFKECHDAWRSGVEALKNMTSEDIQHKFGSVEKMEDYTWVAQKLSIEACEEEENFRDVLDDLAAGKDGSLPLNPEVCYIVRAMAPQRFWKAGMGSRGILDLGESQAYSEKPGDGGVFHSEILDAHAAMTKRWEESLVKVGLRVRKDMKELAKEIYYEQNPSREKPFCEGNWKTATQACKEEAKAAIKSDPIAALPQLFEGDVARYDEIPTAENAGMFLKLSILSSTLNDPEVHAVFVGALEKKAQMELRIWKPEIEDFVSAHTELSSDGSFEPRTQVLESQEKSFEKAGLQKQFKELTEEDLGEWNSHINEMMEKLMHDKGFTMAVPEARSKVTLEKLEELVRLSKYTKEQLEDHRFIMHCWEHDFSCGINYRTLFRYLPDEGSRNDPKKVAAALQKEVAFQNVDPVVMEVSSRLLFLLANPELWKDDELMNLYIDTYVKPNSHALTQSANENFKSVGLRLREVAPAQFQKVLQAAEAGTEIVEDCQHTLREIFGSKESQAQSLVEERPSHGYLCEGLSPLTLCLTRRKEYKLSFDCREDKLIVTSFTDEHEGVQFHASLDENLTSIPKSEPFGVDLEVPAGIPGKYTLHGILDDGNVNKVRLHVYPSGHPEKFPDGANFLYDLETCQT